MDKEGVIRLKTIPTFWQKYEVDAEARPSAFVVTYESETQPDSFEWFIFQIDGDTLTLCKLPRGRPTEFIADKGSTQSPLQTETCQS